MNLVIDIGNTRAKAAVFDGEKIVETVQAEAFTTEDAERLLAKYPAVDRAIVSSVRGGEEALIEVLRGRLKRVVHFDADTPVPIRNAYATPATLGRDRLAAAVGAAAIFPDEDVLVVDLGTAITLDLVTADGIFRGGNISPGAAMRFSALHEYTAKLPLRKLTEPAGLLGTSTAEAIENGVAGGIICEVEGTAEKLYGIYPSLRILFTGGDAHFFEKRVKFPIFASLDLVLTGLNKILEYNAQ